MAKRYPEPKGVYNFPAEEGTAAHELREFCIRLGVYPQDCLGMTFNNIEVDQYMVDGVSLDVNYVRRLEIEYGVKPLIEQRVTMNIKGRSDIFGTADTTFIVPKLRLVHSIDFKYGRMPVEVKDNSQLAGYGVSTLDTFHLWDDIDTVRTSIVQPRYDHTDGPIRTHDYSYETMVELANMFQRSVELADNLKTKPHAGSWCKYCRATGNCRARMLKTLDVAYRAESLDDVSNEELELLMLELPATKYHLEELNNEARNRAVKGSRFDNFKVVMSRPRKKCSDEKHLIAEAKVSISNTDRLFDKKLKSFSAISKVLPEALVNKYYVAPPASEVLVPMSDKRVAKIVGSVRKGTFGKINKGNK